MFPVGENEPQVPLSQTLGKLFSIAPVIVHALLYRYSALKRTKAYSALEDVRPTLRDKPAGLRADWHNTVSRSSAPRQSTARHLRSTSSSTLSSTLSTSPSTPSPPPPEFNHVSSLLAISPPPVFSQGSPFSLYRSPIPFVDSKAVGPHYRREDPPIVRVSYLSTYNLGLSPSSLLPCLVHTRTSKAESSNPVSGTFHNGYEKIFVTCISVESLSGCV
jgi:hypothetical protein